MSIRVKNGITYYRYSRTIDGVRYYYEEKNPPLEILEKHRHFLSDKTRQLIFEKYPEGHPQYIPLKLIEYGVPIKDAYSLKLDQIDFNSRLIKGSSKVYIIPYDFVFYLKDKAYKNMELVMAKGITYKQHLPINIYDNGREVNWKTSYDVSRWIRTHIDPYFSFKLLAKKTGS